MVHAAFSAIGSDEGRLYIKYPSSKIPSDIVSCKIFVSDGQAFMRWKSKFALLCCCMPLPNDDITEWLKNVSVTSENPRRRQVYSVRHQLINPYYMYRASFCAIPIGASPNTHLFQSTHPFVWNTQDINVFSQSRSLLHLYLNYPN